PHPTRRGQGSPHEVRPAQSASRRCDSPFRTAAELCDSREDASAWSKNHRSRSTRTELYRVHQGQGAGKRSPQQWGRVPWRIELSPELAYSGCRPNESTTENFAPVVLCERWVEAVSLGCRSPAGRTVPLSGACALFRHSRSIDECCRRSSPSWASSRNGFSAILTF